ncbi:MAG: hypothetical protein QNJ23_03850 [Woeseiaceae bacterium]|nr:hypothetical protein [Woeseiaceae bacterium]
MGVRIHTAMILALFGIAACGGGGGGGGGGKPPPDYMSFNVSTVIATNVPGGDSIGASVEGTLSQQGQNKFRSGDTIYIVVTHDSPAITSIDVQVFGATGFANILVDNTFAPGTYNATLTVRVCKDAACNNVVSRSTVPFRYVVLEPAIDVDDPLVLQFTQYQDQALPADSTTYDFSRFDLSRLSTIFLNFDTNAQRGDRDTENAWAEMTVVDDTITVTALTSELPCGQADGELIVMYDTFEFSHVARVPIQYTINSLPVVHAVHPKAVYDGQSTDVLVTGCGFDSINAADLRIGGVTPTAATVISDREMNVTVPAGLALGYQDLTFASAAAPVGSPTEQLMVKPAAARPTLEFDLNAGNSKSSMLTLWDEERERLLVADTTGLAQFQNNGTDWQYTQVGGVAGAGGSDQILLSANGDTLARKSSGGLGASVQLYDAETFVSLSGEGLDDTRGAESVAIDKFDQLYVSPRDTRASNYMVFTLEGYLLRDDFGSSQRLSSRSISVASGNKDVVLVSTTKTDRWIRIDTTDNSEQFHNHTDSTGANLRDAWVSFTGAYAEVRNNEVDLGRAVFDANFGFVGRIPDTTSFDDQVQAVRTSGVWIDEAANTALASFSEPTQSGVPATRVRYELYDLTSATNDPFVAIDSVEMTGTYNAGVDDKEENHFLVSDDGETIFRIGDRITIMPNPF